MGEKVAHSHVKIDAATKANWEIHPLCSYLTGKEIKGFPRTRREFYTLDDQTLNRILTELGHEPRGDTSQKRRDLMVSSGILPRDVNELDEYMLEKAVNETPEEPQASSEKSQAFPEESQT
ncbi:hypothetical protein F5Y03DRAFT_403587 [Xylaria venustula]|nr:hypothetical protein F5Y03DRAFT_403587 [Xylaria venustula]